MKWKKILHPFKMSGWPFLSQAGEDCSILRQIYAWHCIVHYNIVQKNNTQKNNNNKRANEKFNKAMHKICRSTGQICDWAESVGRKSLVN